MTGALDRLLAGAADWFLRPDGEADRVRPAPSAARHHRATTRRLPVRSIAVLTEPQCGLAVGATVALALAGSAVALVAVWPAEARLGLAAPAVPAARRLAVSLSARAIEARAVGRIVVAGLPHDETEAVDALRRADAASDVTRVLVLAGARGDDWDGVLLSADAVLVHGSDPSLVGLAVERLARTGASAHALETRLPRPVRALAAAGLALPGALRPLRLTLAEAV
jgi:hypothetical protein